MGKITLDPELKHKLNGLTDPVEICDESGAPVGMYLPFEEYKRLLYQNLTVPFSEAEVEALRKQEGGRTLAEIWKDLKKA